VPLFHEGLGLLAPKKAARSNADGFSVLEWCDYLPFFFGAWLFFGAWPKSLPATSFSAGVDFGLRSCLPASLAAFLPVGIIFS
jgi:hypothetical protein